MDWWTIVGTLASVLGLGVGIYVLYVAKDARRAARDARVLARKRNLTEELEQARKYIEQVGDYLNKREWEAVRIRAQEIMTSCRESLSRWPDGLSEDRRNDVLTVSTSGVSSKAANWGQFKTGQRKWPGTVRSLLGHWPSIKLNRNFFLRSSKKSCLEAGGRIFLGSPMVLVMAFPTRRVPPATWSSSSAGHI